LYLHPLLRATALLAATLGVARAEGGPAGEAEAIGHRAVRWAELAGAPAAVVLTVPAAADATTPVGDALNHVMVALGGKRASIVDLRAVRAPPAAVQVALGRVVDRARADIGRTAAAQGRPVPPDLRTRAWLVADWDGVWVAALQDPACTAWPQVIVFDAAQRPLTRLCAPDPSTAARAFAAALKAAAPDGAAPAPEGAEAGRRAP
jgi:hypothetical protein